MPKKRPKPIALSSSDSEDDVKPGKKALPKRQATHKKISKQVLSDSDDDDFSSSAKSKPLKKAECKEKVRQVDPKDFFGGKTTLKSKPEKGKAKYDLAKKHLQ